MIEKWVVFYNKGSRDHWDQLKLGPFDTQDQALFALLNEAFKRKVNITLEESILPYNELGRKHLNRWAFDDGRSVGYLAAHIDRSR